MHHEPDYKYLQDEHYPNCACFTCGDARAISQEWHVYPSLNTKAWLDEFERAMATIPGLRLAREKRSWAEEHGFGEGVG